MPAPAISSEEHSKALDRVMRRFKAAETARQPYETKWLRFYQAYSCYVKPRTDGKANIFVPEVFSVIESIVPRIIDALFSTYPYVAVFGQDEADQAKAKMQEALLNFQLDQRIGIVAKYVDFVRECLIYGTAVAKVPWRLEQRKVIRRAPGIRWAGPFPIPAMVPKQTTEVAYDDPDMEHIDITDFFIDPQADSLERARYVIHRSWRDMEYLQRMAEQKVYGNVDHLKPGAGEDVERGTQLRLSSIGLGGDGSEDPQDKPIEILEYWEADRVITVANRLTVLRDDPNPFWDKRLPFFAIRNYTKPHEFYGTGEVEPNETQNYELNALRNQRLNFLNQAIEFMWKVLEGGDVNEEELKTRPGGIVHVQNMDDVQPLEMPKLPDGAFAEDKAIREAIQNTSGVFDYAKGASPGRSETATTVVSLQQAAEQRFKLKIRLFEYTGLRELASFIVARNEQFMDRPKVIRVVGEEGAQFQKVTPEQIAGRFDFKPAGSAVEPMANRQVKQDQWVKLYELLKEDPRVDPYELLKKVLEAYEVKDIEKLLKQVEEGQPGAPAATPTAVVPVGPISFSLSSKDPMVVLQTLLQVMQQQQAMVAGGVMPGAVGSGGPVPQGGGPVGGAPPVGGMGNPPAAS